MFLPVVQVSNINITLQSREPWLYSPPQLSPAHHGEKSNILAHLLYPSLDMPKLDLFDLETFINLPTIFANPLEAHHRVEQNPVSVLNAATPPPNLLEETVNVMRRGEAESSGVFYEPKLKLEMEIFGDLSAYWPPTKMMAATKPFQNAVDELNTPVFEKAPFDYDRQSHSSGLLDVVTSTEDPFNFKIKSEISSFDNVNIEDNLMIKEDTIAFNEGESKDISSMMPNDDINTNLGNNYIVISSQGISTNSSNMFIPNNSEYEDIYHNPSDKVTPMYKELMEDDINLTAVNPSEIFLNSNSNDDGMILSNENSSSQFSNPSHQYIILQTTAPFETPDNSRSASEYSENSKSPGLKLNIDQKFKSTNIIGTPDVIETIDAIENEKSFNILNFITDEDIYTAAPALSTINLPALSSLVIPQEAIATSSRSKLTAKRKYKKESDDEDYVPPTKKKVVGCKFAKVQLSSYDTDSDSSDDEFQHKPARRGRPPKRHVSISSEDCPPGKYREMRDKNNEASRKSRLKRKIKESAQEDEANDLEERNTKLKAQVEQLEKTVNNFRNNLMQILLTK